MRLFPPEATEVNAARVGPRLRLSRTPAKPIEACRIARSQSHPLRLSGRGRRRGETPECNPFSGLNHVTREVVIGKPDITSSGSRPEPFVLRGTADAIGYGLEVRSGLPVSRSTGTETCSWITSQLPLIFL